MCSVSPGTSRGVMGGVSPCKLADVLRGMFSGVSRGASRGNSSEVLLGTYSKVSRKISCGNSGGVLRGTSGETTPGVETRVDSEETNCLAALYHSVNSRIRPSRQLCGDDNARSCPVPLYLPHSEENSEPPPRILQKKVVQGAFPQHNVAERS